MGDIKQVLLTVRLIHITKGEGKVVRPRSCDPSIIPVHQRLGLQAVLISTNLCLARTGVRSPDTITRTMAIGSPHIFSSHNLSSFLNSWACTSTRPNGMVITPQRQPSHMRLWSWLRRGAASGCPDPY